MAELSTTVRLLLVDDETPCARRTQDDPRRRPVHRDRRRGRRWGAALGAVRELRPDVVLMDIRMPRLDRLSATEQILCEHPGAEIVVLTSYHVDDLVPRAMRLGACGYLLKDTPPPELVDAVLRVAGGDTILSQAALVHLIAAATKRTAPKADPSSGRRLDELTERERSVARAVAKGLSNAQIAAELSISVTTVKTHIGRVLDKLEVSNRVQIAAIVQRSDL